jgi:hypothetical protein
MGLKMKALFLLVTLATSLLLSVNLRADNKPVAITKDMMGVSVQHNGKSIKIQRNPDNNNIVNPDFAKTSRPCPPFCIQPAVVAPGVETIADVEMLSHLSKMSSGDNSIQSSIHGPRTG